jgi:tetratricopeptide (TPR) repeat protein
MMLSVWLFLAAAIAIAALIAFPLRLGALKEALFSPLRSANLRFDRRQGGVRMALVSAAVFLSITAIGVAISLWRDHSNAIGSASTPSRSDNEALASLKDYTRSIGGQGPEHGSPPEKLLPDVNTMTEQLAARLKTAPGDVKGWRMLGWSYFHTGRYKQAAAALARAIELDPKSAELKSAYDEATAKASEGDSSETAASAEPQAVSKGTEGASVVQNPKSEGGAAREHIQAMVDGLATRLENFPHDADGWARLMRSRIVLGERDVAATAFRKALEVFKDDAAAAGKVKATALELGLKVE